MTDVRRSTSKRFVLRTAILVFLGLAATPAMSEPPRVFETPEITISSPDGKGVHNANSVLTQVTRSGDGIFVVFREREGGAIYLRRIDRPALLRSKDPETDPAVKSSVIELSAWRESAVNDSNHQEPSIVARGPDLDVFWGRRDSSWACANTNSVGAFWRRIPAATFSDPSTWTPDLQCIPSRARNDGGWSAEACGEPKPWPPTPDDGRALKGCDFPAGKCTTCGPFALDFQGVYDRRGDVAYISDEFAGPVPPGARPLTPMGGGLSRAFGRIRPGGARPVDYPYLLVVSTRMAPLDCPGAITGNIFAKGRVVLGREPGSGPRSVWHSWSNRHTFRRGGLQREFTYDLSLARSNDGGDTWTNLAGTVDPPVRLTTGIAHDDPRFRIYSGDIDQASEISYDLDSKNRPVFAIRKPRPGTGTRTCGHLYNPGAGDVGSAKDCKAVGDPYACCTGPNAWSCEPVRYDLVLLRWNGTAWEEHPIDTAADWWASDISVLIDSKDRIWVLAAQPRGEGVPPDRNFNLRVSEDGGKTWSPWTPLALQINAGDHPQTIGRQSVWRDSEDPDEVVFTIYNAARKRQTLKLLRLDGQKPATAPAPPPP